MLAERERVDAHNVDFLPFPILRGDRLVSTPSWLLFFFQISGLDCSKVCYSHERAGTVLHQAYHSSREHNFYFYFHIRVQAVIVFSFFGQRKRPCGSVAG